MDTQVGVWHIKDNQPMRLRRSQLMLEKHLEEWVESHPSMVGQGITIVGRQVHCDGGFIDLLAIDQFTNSWVIIEIKRGTIRRDTVTQALDYAASIDTMHSDDLKLKVDTYLKQKHLSLQQFMDENIIEKDMFGDNRDIQLAVVGTGHDDGLTRMVNYLAEKQKMSIAVIEFDVFEGEDGELSLIRQLTEQDEQSKRVITPQELDNDYQHLFNLADSYGIGQEFRMIYDACTKYGMYARPYKWSIMYTPPEHKGRCLVVAWVYPTYHKLKAYAVPETFAEYFPISETEAIEIVGDGTRQLISLDETKIFIEQLDTLFERISSQQE